MTPLRFEEYITSEHVEWRRTFTEDLIVRDNINGQVVVAHCYFYRNFGGNSDNGGAVYCAINYKFVFHGCSVYQCKCGQQGGGVFANQNNEKGSMPECEINYCCFSQCFGGSEKDGHAYAVIADNFINEYVTSDNCPNSNLKFEAVWLKTKNNRINNCNITNAMTTEIASFYFQETEAIDFKYNSISKLTSKKMMYFNQVKNNIELRLMNVLDCSFNCVVDSSNQALICFSYFHVFGISGFNNVRAEFAYGNGLTLQNSIISLPESDKGGVQHQSNVTWGSSARNTIKIDLLDFASCPGVVTPPKYRLITESFTLSGIFTQTHSFTKTDQFVATDSFSKSSDFSASHVFSRSSEFSLSGQFTSSPPFTSSHYFSGSDQFSGTNQFTGSSPFSQSSEFTKSNSFTRSILFSSSSPFTKSSHFTGSEQFTGSVAFSKSETFTKSNQFSKSIPFSKSNLFTASKKFTPSDFYGQTLQFTKSSMFTSSNVFSQSSKFSPSDGFTPSNKFTSSSKFTKSIQFTPSKKFTPSNKFTESNKFTSSKSFTPTPTEKFSPSVKFSESSAFTQSDFLNITYTDEPTKSATPVEKIDVAQREPEDIKEFPLIPVIAGAAGGFLLIIIIIIVTAILIKKRKKSRKEVEAATSDSSPKLTENSSTDMGEYSELDSEDGSDPETDVTSTEPETQEFTFSGRPVEPNPDPLEQDFTIEDPNSS